MTYVVTVFDKPANRKRKFQPVSEAAIEPLKEVLLALGYEIVITELETDSVGNPVLETFNP